MQSVREDSLPLRAESPHGRLCRQYVVIEYCAGAVAAGKGAVVCMSVGTKLLA